MRSAPRRARGPAGRGVLAVLSSAVVLTACGGSAGSGQEAAGSAGSASSSNSAALTSGLLKPAAFGPQATVVAITVEQLQKGAGLAAAAGNLQVTPPQCANAVHGTQPQVGDLHDVA